MTPDGQVNGGAVGQVEMLRGPGGELQVEERELQEREVEVEMPVWEAEASRRKVQEGIVEVQGRDVDVLGSGFGETEVQGREVEVLGSGFGEAEVHLKKLSDYKTLSKVRYNSQMFSFFPMYFILHLSPVTCLSPVTFP